jgi:hypothetical protein
VPADAKMDLVLVDCLVEKFVFLYPAKLLQALSLVADAALFKEQADDEENDDAIDENEHSICLGK